jgi:hypothetical protein
VFALFPGRSGALAAATRDMPAMLPPAADLIRAPIMEEPVVKGPEEPELSGCKDIDGLLGNPLSNQPLHPLLP